MTAIKLKVTVGPLSERPTAAAAGAGALYRTTDNGAEKTYRSNGSTWVDQDYGGGGAWPGFYESNPAALGTASPGVAATAAHGDHVHSSAHAHAATDVTQDATHRFATDSEKSTWNGKEAGGAVAAHAAVTASVHGFDSSGCAPPAIHGSMSHSEAYEVTGAKNAANGYCGLDASTLVPVARMGTGTPTGAKFLRDDRTWQAPAGGSTPPWHGALYGAFGGCNPADMLQLMYSNPINATPTNIGTAVGRCAYFRPPADIAVQKIRFFGVGATTAVYHVAIYAGVAGGARLTADLGPNTAAQAWGVAGSSLGLALTAGTLYAICVGIDTVGTTAGMHCMSSTTGRIGVLPASWPGNLDVDLASPIIDPCALFQVALSTGAMPATLPTIAAQAAWTGGMPAFFLDANNA